MDDTVTPSQGYYVFVLGWDTLQNQVKYGACSDTYPALSAMIDDCKIKTAQPAVHFILLCPCLDYFSTGFSGAHLNFFFTQQHLLQNIHLWQTFMRKKHSSSNSYHLYNTKNIIV